MKRNNTTNKLFFVFAILIMAGTSNPAFSQVWNQLGLDLDGEAANDRSGRSVSMSADGKTVAIGAFVNDGNGTDAGHTRVYKLISGVWTQLG